jgi:catechol 2,3-dioxygenase-like lactoylglutathione lyase family enzyme
MTTKTDVKLSRVGYVMIPVRDLARSLAYYRDALGLAVRFAGDEFAFLDAGGVALALRKAGNPGPAPADHSIEIVFEVDDIDAAYEALRARGVEFRIAPRPATGDRHVTDFRDPDGHVLSIFGPKR